MNIAENVMPHTQAFHPNVIIMPNERYTKDNMKNNSSTFRLFRNISLNGPNLLTVIFSLVSPDTKSKWFPILSPINNATVIYPKNIPRKITVIETILSLFE
ncbi:hypothetical protein MCHI_000340 [Candidatus Magnetoovum chiemensis]|nr:hypothetical protein MCHI_000340 [Candidatus Magnetoovum chiemensis]